MVLHLRAQVLGEGDEHLPMLLVVYGKLYIFTLYCIMEDDSDALWMVEQLFDDKYVRVDVAEGRRSDQGRGGRGGRGGGVGHFEGILCYFYHYYYTKVMSCGGWVAKVLDFYVANLRSGLAVSQDSFVASGRGSGLN